MTAAMAGRAGQLMRPWYTDDAAAVCLPRLSESIHDLFGAAEDHSLGESDALTPARSDSHSGAERALRHAARSAGVLYPPRGRTWRPRPLPARRSSARSFFPEPSRLHPRCARDAGPPLHEMVLRRADQGSAGRGAVRERRRFPHAAAAAFAAVFSSGTDRRLRRSNGAACPSVCGNAGNRTAWSMFARK